METSKFAFEIIWSLAVIILVFWKGPLFKVEIIATNLQNTKRAKSPGALLPISHETEKLDLSLQRNISTLEDSMVSFSMHCIRGRSLTTFCPLLTSYLTHVDIVEEIPLMLYGQICIIIIGISSKTYLLHFFNVVKECPII